MADSSDSVSIDMDSISLGGKEHHIKTSHGSVSVVVSGDQDKPALITYPDLALNYMSCFEGIFSCPPPGHELGAAILSSENPVLSVDDLADQVAEILDYFGLDAVMCMGVTGGAYILALFAGYEFIFPAPRNIVEQMFHRSGFMRDSSNKFAREDGIIKMEKLFEA